ncbi:MAG: glycosyltransferase family 4 protein [Bacteroidetes bacterium]|nr:glycosyltransferase family 4 protein [Bacteroidota bacterium]HET6245117.1 glycosyltransferase family 1 protein [Bacteroidia bacterium]
MIIAFDAKRAFFNTSGLGNYSRTLIKNICHFYPQNSYKLFSPVPNSNKKNCFPDLPQNAELIFPQTFTGKLISPLWRSWKITEEISRNKAIIYHGLSNELPFNIKYSGAKSIVTIHDLIFLRYPKLYPAFDRTMYALKFKKACMDADSIIAVSTQTKNDLTEFFNINPSKIYVVYQSCDPSYFSFEENKLTYQKIKIKYNLPENYLLYVGTIEERKNLLSLLKALNQLPGNFNLPIVVIGNKRKDYFKIITDFIASNKLQNKVIFPQGVLNSELPFIYNNAQIFIYPSLFEGFGIPVLEALLCKVPVITSNCSSLPEAAGPSSCLINPLAPEEIAQQIQAILNDSDQRKIRVEQGLIYAQNFSAKNTSTQLMNMYGLITGYNSEITKSV